MTKQSKTSNLTATLELREGVRSVGTFSVTLPGATLLGPEHARYALHAAKVALEKLQVELNRE